MIKNRICSRASRILASLILVLCLTATSGVAQANADVQGQLNALVDVDEMTGAVVRVDDCHGRHSSHQAGLSRRGSGEAMVDGEARYRIGSLTKPVVAATVLLLVEQGAVELSSPVEKYLPGQVRGTGDGAAIDGRLITVRQLMQHVSGLPEFSDVMDGGGDQPPSVEEQLRVALQRAPEGRPGEKFFNANTNYLVLGMIINAVTDQDFRQVVTERVLRPLNMQQSYWPARGETGIRGVHAHTYAVDPDHPEHGLVDVTETDGYSLGASGGLISTPADLNRFWRGLFAGELLSRSTVREMTARTVPVPDQSWPDEARYGLGIASAELPCSGEVWMHGGGLVGVTTLTGRAKNGRAATVYVTGNLATAEGGARLQRTLDLALCDR